MIHFPDSEKELPAGTDWNALLAPAERYRKIAAFRPLAAILGMALFLAPGFGIIFWGGEEWTKAVGGLLLFAGLFTGIFCLARYLPSVDDASLRYKKVLIPALLKAQGLGWQFSAETEEAIAGFRESALCTEKTSQLLREDLLKGRINGRPFFICQLTAQQYTMPRSRGRWVARPGVQIEYPGTQVTNNFFGWFIRLDAAFSFPGKLCLIPAKISSDQMVDEWARDASAYHHRHSEQVSYLADDPVFDDRFFAFSADSAAALHFLDEKRRKNLLHIQSLFEHPVGITFYGNHIYFLAGLDYDPFDVKTFLGANRQTLLLHWNELKRLEKTLTLLLS